MIWSYIREHNLQDPADRRRIILDSPMMGVFGTEAFTMFTMNKFLTDHLHAMPQSTDADGTKDIWDAMIRLRGELRGG